jgi:SAM-dependent methyltransferase
MDRPDPSQHPEATVAAIPFVPADAAAHARLGDWYAAAQRPVEAQAQYRTALALGLEKSDIPHQLADITAKLAATSLARLDHNRYARMRTLAAVVGEYGPGARVLDLGGGDGMLALFLPEAHYVLAEPGTNGLSAQGLPFAAGGFDLVLCCHVLEHIPAQDRDAFLARLCELAGRELVLLNPFRPDEADPAGSDPWLEMVWQITAAPWAAEHLACGFPALGEVQRFAEDRGFACRCTPNGTRAISTLHVLLSHYAHLAGRSADLGSVNLLLNGLEPASLDSPLLPTAWLVRIKTGGDQKDGSP